VGHTNDTSKSTGGKVFPTIRLNAGFACRILKGRHLELHLYVLNQSGESLFPITYQSWAYRVPSVGCSRLVEWDAELEQLKLSYSTLPDKGIHNVRREISTVREI
jgi:hypothetical protein